MSDVWLNFRIWIYHFQAGRREWWRVEIIKNEYHRGNKESSFFAFYQLSRPASFIGGVPSKGNGICDDPSVPYDRW